LTYFFHFKSVQKTSIIASAFIAHHGYMASCTCLLLFMFHHVGVRRLAVISRVL